MNRRPDNITSMSFALSCVTSNACRDYRKAHSIWNNYLVSEIQYEIYQHHHVQRLDEMIPSYDIDCDKAITFWKYTCT